MESLTRSRWAAIGAAVAVTLGGGGLIGVSASGVGDSAALVAVDPVRILDTRQDTKVTASTRLVQVTGPVRTYSGSGATTTVVPAGATSVAMNLTVTEGVREGGYGFVTAFPCAAASDPVPNASTLNFVEGTDVANGVVVPLGSGGAICLNVYGSAHLIVDVSGYYSEGRLDDIEADIATNAEEIATKADQSMVDRLASDRRPSFVETPVSVATSTGPAGIAVEQGVDGLPVMTHIAAGGALTVTACDDVGCAGDGEVSSVLDVGEVTDADLAIGLDGMPVVAFRTATPELGVVVCTSFDCSTHRDPVILDDRAGTGETPDIAIGVGGNPVIAYTVASPPILALVACDDPLCEGAGDEYNDVWTAAESAVYPQHPHVAIDRGGTPVIAFQDKHVGTGLDFALFVYICGDSACAAGGPMVLQYTGRMGSNVNTGFHPSVTVDSEGGLAIVYGEIDFAPDPDVWSIQAYPLASLSAPFTVKDALPGPVRSTAVRIGASGTPVIAYAVEDAGSQRIDYLVCEYRDCDPAAAAPVVFEGLDECGAAGCGLSMAMVGGGLPVIAYHDGTTASSTVNVHVPWWTVGGR
ncbi:MAG: hypothetical protein ACO35E_09910 [Ilumatobacteraceae bacterium]